MTLNTRLGGFKILKQVGWISFRASTGQKAAAAKFSHLMAKEKINLSFLNCAYRGHAWNLDAVVDASEAQSLSAKVEKGLGIANQKSNRSSILSLFPHKSNPEITAELIRLLADKSIQPASIAQSSSSISVVVKESLIEPVTKALFSSFDFSTYRTPEDWKLAQKGKERLFKEVVASYQEKKPKVYSLDLHENQILFRLNLYRGRVHQFCLLLERLAREGIAIPFFISSPFEKKEGWKIFLCLPGPDHNNYRRMFKDMSCLSQITSSAPVSVFSMTGPHFGDRYGIASEIFLSIQDSGTDLMGLCCSIATVTGLLPQKQVRKAAGSLQRHFDIPAVVIK